MSDRKFGAFILTYGRPDRIHTIGTLRKHGYTGPIHLVCDSSDPTLDQYREQFGDDLIVFDKADLEGTFDTGDNETSMRGVVYARNINPSIARDLGYTHFIQLDDDYKQFLHRWALPGDPTLYSATVKDLDRVLEAMLDFMDTADADTVAMAQGGDLIGGTNGRIGEGMMRKAMNSFLFRTDRPVVFPGRVNEDVNAYVVYGARGRLWFTVLGIQLIQPATQQYGGGMTGLYLEGGTFVKSFYTVMMAPSCTRVWLMGPTAKRFHHEVKWERAVPKILSDRYRKPIG